MNLRNTTDVGALIRDARTEQHLSQHDLAVRVGVSRQWIVEVEHGKPRAELGLVLKTLRALGITLRASSHDPSSPAQRPPDRLDLDAIIRRARDPSR